MSGSLPGVAFSGLPLTPQTADGDALLVLQTGQFRQLPSKALVASYTPAGAVLVGAGNGASRGLPAYLQPTGGEPLQGYALDATLQVLPPPAAGGYPLIGANTGTTAGTVAAGNDPRILAGAGAAAAASQALQTASNLAGVVAQLEATIASLQAQIQSLQGGGAALSVGGVTITVDGQPLTP